MFTGTSATAGAARPAMAGTRAACGRPPLTHGGTRGAATPPALVEISRLFRLGLLGVGVPTPSALRRVITITIAIVPSCTFTLVLPLREEALWLGGVGWRSMAAAGTMLTGFFCAYGAPFRRGDLAALVVTAFFSVLTAGCELPHRGDAHGTGAAGSCTRAISDLGALHYAAGSAAGAPSHRIHAVATWASTTGSRRGQPLLIFLAMRFGYREDPAHVMSSMPRSRRLRLPAPPSYVAYLWNCSGVSVIPMEEGMSRKEGDEHSKEARGA